MHGRRACAVSSYDLNLPGLDDYAPSKQAQAVAVPSQHARAAIARISGLGQRRWMQCPQERTSAG